MFPIEGQPDSNVVKKDRKKRHGKELIIKAREAALCAIRLFNDPQVTFKSETYIVLMVIAWTYLLHAYYRKHRVEYRHFTQREKRKVFHRTKNGRYKYWELERCLNCDTCPLDDGTKLNLRFLIELRHEIEHQMTQSLDAYLGGRYQACALNFNHHIQKLFGTKYGLDSLMTFSIQFVQLTEEQLAEKWEDAHVPDKLKAFITVFEDNLTHDQYNCEQFSYRMLFKRKLVNKPGQADKVIEFIDPHSESAKAIDREYWVKKEVERPKFRASDVVNAVRPRIH